MRQGNSFTKVIDYRKENWTFNSMRQVLLLYTLSISSQTLSASFPAGTGSKKPLKLTTLLHLVSRYRKLGASPPVYLNGIVINQRKHVTIIMTIITTIIVGSIQ